MYESKNKSSDGNVIVYYRRIVLFERALIVL